MAIKIGWNDGHTTSRVGTGAVGIIKETDRNRRVGAKARAILENEYEGVTIIDCTINTSDNDMRDAVNKANINNVDVFISNHVNAGGGVGFETFYSRKSTASNIAKANIIHKHICNTKSCLDDRRCCSDFSYKGYDFYVLVNTKMDAILVELGFVDNQKCIDAFNEDEVARALAIGIAESYSIKKKSNLSNRPSTATTSDLYRVRKSWGDAATQIGAYSNLENAKKECNKNLLYSVFNSNGIKVYPIATAVPKPPVYNKKFLNLHPHNASWRIYPIGVPAIVGNECGRLAPSKYGGLSYSILEDRGDIKIIETEYWGKVQIYAPRDNDSSITSSPVY